MRITNECPRARIATTPSTPRRARRRPPTGTQTQGEPPMSLPRRCHRVGAEADERALAERDVARVAGDDVQPTAPMAKTIERMNMFW